VAAPHEAGDRESSGEPPPRREHRGGDRLARPGKAGQEELRQAGGKKDERRRLRVLEPGTSGLAHEARRQNEQRRERKYLQWTAERREAVEPRQHDQVERQRRKIDGEVRQAAAKHIRERRGTGLWHRQR